MIDPHKQRTAIPIVSESLADLHVQLDAIERQHGVAADTAALRAKVNAADPQRFVYAALTATDAKLGAAQLRTIAQLFNDRMPDETRELLARIAASLEGAS
jgi:hypothetical protein